jgi:hypothetical protein
MHNLCYTMYNQRSAALLDSYRVKLVELAVGEIARDALAGNEARSAHTTRQEPGLKACFVAIMTHDLPINTLNNSIELLGLSHAQLMLNLQKTQQLANDSILKLCPAIGAYRHGCTIPTNVAF